MKRININNFDEKIYYQKLENGLDIYFLPTPHKKNNIGMFVSKFGGKYKRFITDGQENEIISGTAHFLEHKLFDQSDGSSALNFYAQNGANVNAWTGTNSTVYYFSGCNNYEENLEYLINYVSNLYLTKDSVEKERGIIIEELKMYQDDAEWQLYDRIRKNAFILDDMKASVGGEIEDVKRITKEDLKKCYDVFYQPSNMILLVAGNFKPLEIMNKISKEFIKYSKMVIPFKIKEEEEPDEVSKEYEELVMETANPKFAYTLKINYKNIDMDQYTLCYYLNIIANLCFGRASKFKNDMLRENMFNYFSISTILGKNHFLFTFLGESNKIEEFLIKLNDYLNELNVSKEEFERLKKVWIASEIKMIDDSEMTLNNIIYDIINYQEYKNNKIDDIKKLNHDDLNKVLKILSNKYSATVIINPKNHK